MPWPFQPSSKAGGQGIPYVVGYPVASGETFYNGAPVTIASGELEEVDTDDVIGIAGVALMGAKVAATPDWGDEVLIAISDDATIFNGAVSITGSAVATDISDVEVGAQYGIVKISNTWYVDYSDTSTVVLEVLKVDLDNAIVFFKFLASTRDDV